MARTARARVSPDLIRWAREDAGYSVEEAAKKVGVSPERFAEWEAGAGRPTIRQLRLLANACRRPLAVFYLPTPPKKFQAMHDYRRLPGDVIEEGSPTLRLEIRKAFTRRAVAMDLLSDLDEDVPRFRLRAQISEAPESVGARIRSALAVDGSTTPFASALRPVTYRSSWEFASSTLAGSKNVFSVGR